MTTTTMPSPTDQKNDADAAIMLYPILMPQTETTPLEDDEYHDLRNTLKTAGFNIGNLIDAGANQAYEALNSTCMTNQQVEQIAHLVNRGFALPIKPDNWSRFGISTTWDNDHYPETLRCLEENPPPLIQQCGNSDPMTEPDNNIAVLTDGPASNPANSLIALISELINRSKRTLVVSTTPVASEALLLKTTPKSRSPIAITGQQSLYDMSLSQNFHDATMDKRASSNQVHD